MLSGVAPRSQVTLLPTFHFYLKGLLSTAVTGAVSGINTYYNIDQQNYLDEQQESIKSLKISVDTLTTQLTTSVTSLEAKVTALQSDTTSCKMFIYNKLVIKK